MATLKEQILAAVAVTPGLTDRGLTDRLLGTKAGPQAINQAARQLTRKGQIDRHTRPDGKIGNYPATNAEVGQSDIVAPVSESGCSANELSEDDVKRTLQDWLQAAAWQVKVMWAKKRGIDIEAERGGQRWLIEAKGCGSLDPMRVNYFLAILGELLQRMDDPNARYSIAFPDLKQYRGLWRRLPGLAKERTGITALFVAPDGTVVEDPAKMPKS